LECFAPDLKKNLPDVEKYSNALSVYGLNFRYVSQAPPVENQQGLVICVLNSEGQQKGPAVELIKQLKEVQKKNTNSQICVLLTSYEGVQISD